MFLTFQLNTEYRVLNTRPNPPSNNGYTIGKGFFLYKAGTNPFKRYIFVPSLPLEDAFLFLNGTYIYLLVPKWYLFEKVPPRLLYLFFLRVYEQLLPSLFKRLVSNNKSVIRITMKRLVRKQLKCKEFVG